MFNEALIAKASLCLRSVLPGMAPLLRVTDGTVWAMQRIKFAIRLAKRLEIAVRFGLLICKGMGCGQA